MYDFLESLLLVTFLQSQDCIHNRDWDRSGLFDHVQLWKQSSTTRRVLRNRNAHEEDNGCADGGFAVVLVMEKKTFRTK